MRSVFLFLCLSSAVVLAVAPTVYLLDSLDASGNDCNGHGSLMKRIILDFAPANTRFIYYNTYDDKCQDQTFLITAAFDNISRQPQLDPASIISIGGGFYADVLVLPSIRSLLARGLRIYAGAGNDGTGACLWPAIQSGVIAVEMVNSKNATQVGSNFCASKNRTEVQWASVCGGTSVATATLAGRALSGQFDNYVVPGVTDCGGSATLPPQWVYFGPTLGGALGAILFCLVLYLSYLFYLKERPNLVECHPRCLHPCQ